MLHNIIQAEKPIEVKWDSIQSEYRGILIILKYSPCIYCTDSNYWISVFITLVGQAKKANRFSKFVLSDKIFGFLRENLDNNQNIHIRKLRQFREPKDFFTRFSYSRCSWRGRCWLGRFSCSAATWWPARLASHSSGSSPWRCGSTSWSRSRPRPGTTSRGRRRHCWERRGWNDLPRKKSKRSLLWLFEICNTRIHIR